MSTKTYYITDKEELIINTSLLTIGKSEIEEIPFNGNLGKEISKQEFQLKLAEKISKIAHEGQVDKGGTDYFSGHIQSVVSGVNSAEEKTLAYIHDLIEDTDYSLVNITKYFSQEIIEALVLVTKTNRKQDYLEYINNIKTNPLARKVKLADLENNSDLSRLKVVTEKDEKRILKYKKAIQILSL